MIVVLWVLAASLGMVFMGAGAIKLARSKAQLHAGGMRWTEELPSWGVKGIGAAEVSAGVALIVPLVTRTATVLVPIAALGLALLMTGAVLVHRRREESWVVPAALGAAAVVTAALGFIHLVR